MDCKAGCDADGTELIHIKIGSNFCVEVVDHYDTTVCTHRFVIARVCVYMYKWRKEREN
jgi:hypothetical protein